MWRVSDPSDEALAAWKTLQRGSKNIYLCAMVRALATEDKAPELDAEGVTEGELDEVTPEEDPWHRARRDDLDEENPFAATVRALSTTTCKICNAA